MRIKLLGSKNRKLPRSPCWLLPIVFFAVLGCKSEAETDVTLAPAKAQLTESTAGSEKQVSQAVQIFSNALKDKSRSQFLMLADSQGVNLIRLFTSGNLGGRGESLSRSTQPGLISDDLEFPVEKQTPFALSIMFPSLPIDSTQTLQFSPMQLDAKQLPMDQWAVPMKSALAKLPNMKEGALVVLTEQSNTYWILADAQIIDDALVGGFAVFKREGETIKLVGLIDLL